MRPNQKHTLTTHSHQPRIQRNKNIRLRRKPDRGQPNRDWEQTSKAHPALPQTQETQPEHHQKQAPPRHGGHRLMRHRKRRHTLRQRLHDADSHPHELQERRFGMKRHGHERQKPHRHDPHLSLIHI